MVKILYFYFCIVDQCESQHKTASSITDPDGSPALPRRGSIISVDLSETTKSGSIIQTDPGSGSTGSDPGTHFRDQRACLLTKR